MLVPKSLVYFLRLPVGHCGHRSLSKKCLFPPISTFLSFPYTQPKAEQILLCRCHGTRGGPLWSFCKLHMHTYVFLSLRITFVNAVSQAILYLITFAPRCWLGWGEEEKNILDWNCRALWQSLMLLLPLPWSLSSADRSSLWRCLWRVGQAFSCWPSKGISNGLYLFLHLEK